MHRTFSTRLGHVTKESQGFVSTKFESLDYECYDNMILIQEEERRGKIFMATVILQRVILFLLIGALTGICGSLVDLGVHYGCSFKYSFLAEEFDTHFQNNKTLLFALWMLGIMVPGVLGCLVVIYIQPFAAGGGINWTLGYLNGVNLNAYNTIGNLIVKICSNILCCVSGLPGGKEAPLIHVGAIVGTQMPLLGWGKFKPFEYFIKDPERRDMGAAGTAAGLTSAFACPIAGIMLAFEESLSYWNVELTFLIFLCALSAFVTLLFIVKSVLQGCTDCFATEQNLFLDVLHRSNHSFRFLEVIVFIFLGAIGGTLGALWNAIQKRLILFRKRYVNTTWKRIIEIIIVAFVNGLVQITYIFAMGDYCVKKIEDHSINQSHHGVFPKLDCRDDEDSVMGILLFQSQLSTLRGLFTPDESLIGIVPLAFFGIYIFFGSCWLAGCYITHGIFVPHILIGAVWGRLTAEIIQYIIPQTKSWARPNIFAFLCGAAQLSGSLHITFTISVMMLEIGNATALSIPIFIVVSFSKLIGSMFNESIYHTQVCLAGIPILSKEAPPLLSGLRSTDVMNKSDTITLPVKTSHTLLRDTLMNCNHNGFPVVDSAQVSKDGDLVTYGTLKGLILRSQILVILNNKLTDDSLKDNRRISSNLRRASIIKRSMINEIDPNAFINLEPFMNPSPYFINTKASVSQAYRLFSGLGLRHLVVVTDNQKVVGVITRKDLSVFRHHAVGFRPESHILPLK